MPYRSLNPDAILRTVDRLKLRVSERFPNRGLADVAADLADLAREEVGRAKKLSRPRIGLRLLVTLVIAAALAALAYGGWTYKLGLVETETEAFHLFQGIEALINIGLLAGAGIFFLLQLETRSKRAAVLVRLNQLRSIAHVIDMHQLTKDPTLALHSVTRTESSPVRDLDVSQLLRYLDYCAEMLALTGKLAAVYLEHTEDPVIIAAVGEFENLTSDLTRKVWLKISVLEASAGAMDMTAEKSQSPSETDTDADETPISEATSKLPAILE
ncbi:MAG: hypothetical protein AAFZ91_10530 [Pseudomonadota bacterium]